MCQLRPVVESTKSKAAGNAFTVERLSFKGKGPNNGGPQNVDTKDDALNAPSTHTPLAAHGDVVESCGHFNPWSSCHAENLPHIMVTGDH